MIRKIVNRVKNSIWLYPALYSVGSLLLAVSIAAVDQRFTGVSAHRILHVFATTSGLAQTVLGIIAAAFITIATFTFSTAMVVLTMYSSQFTPRVVENFLSNQTTMKSFGVFLSGFIYAITSLLLIKESGESRLVIAASVGVLYVIVGLVYFLIFINSVSSQIQASGLIRRLYEEASARIGQYRAYLDATRTISAEDWQKRIGQQEPVEVKAAVDGYIQEIDFDQLRHIAGKHGWIICIRKVVGQFVAAETRVASVFLTRPDALGEEEVREIQACLLTGSKRTETQDFGFTIQKVAEIALKALSPGINDPHTAIHCLTMIGLLLRELADVRRGYIVLGGEDDDGLAVSEAFDFEMILYDAYHQIIHYGQADAAVMIAVFKSLRFVKAKASQQNSQVIDTYAAQLFERMKQQGYDALEARMVAKEYRDLATYR
ncbi:MAG: DUF2254 domain-containing protein [Clostridiaceae bacterium]|nr:DUF2254 domain-containing protein [Clostridiaceae bacterium]